MTTTDTHTQARTAAVPRFATRRRPERRTLGGRVAKFADLLGTPLMPWQRDLVDVALELDEQTGRLAYREVVVTVPRQQGKTTLVLSVEADVCVNRAPATVIYTAQTGADARKKLLEEHVPMLLQSQLGVLIDKIDRAKGEEAVRFFNGSQVRLNAGSESSGHGAVVDAGFIDEAFKDVDNRREGAILPAMVTRPHGQMWVVSTQGTGASAYLNRKCEMGRAAAAADSGTGVCYVEYSAGQDDDPADPATWWGCMPALGHTIDEAVVRHAFQTMELPEFKRAFLNVQDSSATDRPIPEVLWVRVADESASPSDGIVLAVEASIDGSAASLVVADRYGAVEVVDNRPGVDWVPGRVFEVWKRHRCRVVIDSRGPAKQFLQPLRLAGVPVEELSTGQVAEAAIVFLSRVADRSLRVRPSAVLDLAVEAGRRRWSGEQWFWARKDAGSDVSPLVAASLAVFMAADVVDDSPSELVIL